MKASNSSMVHLPSVLRLGQWMPLAFALSALLPTHANAVNVDSELVLLIDATQAGLNANQFDRVMSGYATAFTSSSVLDSIESGAYGKIAISLVFFGNSNSYQVGIPWMEIGNLTQAQQFASLIQSVIRPTYTGASNIAAALTSAAFTFGTETGGAANGFESEVQMIEVAASRVPNAGAASATAAASNIVRAAGVDQINSVALGTNAAAIDAFYAANVVGSTIANAPATNTTSALNAAALATNLTSSVTSTVQTGATTSQITAVPEPTSTLSLALGVILCFKRRRNTPR